MEGWHMNRRRALKLLGAGSCGASALLAGALYRRSAGTASADRAGRPWAPFGLFDVDCRELNRSGDGLDFRPRVAPLVDRLKQLYAAAERRRAPLVFTTCCSGRKLRLDSVPGVVFVPLDAAQRQWEAQVPAQRLFHLEKDGSYEMFKHNGNAVRLVQSLNVGEWIIFGNGFDLCIDSDVRALLAAGQKVCLLSDVYARSAGGYFVPTSRGRFETATAENEARILAEFRRLGVRSATLAEFLASIS
jgi:nicotinamidase-related amidase